MRKKTAVISFIKTKKFLFLTDFTKKQTGKAPRKTGALLSETDAGTLCPFCFRHEDYTGVCIARFVFFMKIIP